MLNKINNIFDQDTEEKYLEKYAPDSYKKSRVLTGLMFVMFSALIFLSTFNIYNSNQRKEGKLYAVNPETNEVLRISMKKSPMFSNEKFSLFITSVMEGVFSTDFSRVDKDLGMYKKYFTNVGWQSFEIQFINQFAKYIKENSLISNLTITTKPVLVSQRRFTNGKTQRTYALFGFLNYKGAIKATRGNTNTNYPVKMMLVVEFSETTKSPYGLLIKSIKVN